MKQHRMLDADGVFVRAELGKLLLKEVVKPPTSFDVREEEAQVLSSAGVVGELAINLLGRFGDFCRGVCDLGRRNGKPLGELLSVFGVEAPLPAFGAAVGGEQDSEPLTLGGIEAGHGRSLSGEMSLKILGSA